MRLLSWTLVACTVVWQTGCSCGTGTGPSNAKYRFTAQGQGPEGKNLDPHRIGQASNNFNLLIDGVVQTPSGLAVRAHQFELETFTATIETEAGVFVVGSTQDGALENPTLLVPATVRVGMKWDVFLDKPEPAYRYEVTKREEGTGTPFGTATAWTIVQTRADGTTLERVYAEGFGPVGFRPQVWPLESPAGVLPTPRPITISPMPLPPELAFSQNAPWIDAVSMVRVDDGPAMVLIAGSIVQSQSVAMLPSGSGCALTDGQQVTALANSDGKPFRRTKGPVCPRVTFCVPSPVVGETRRCGPSVLHANGAWVGPDGTVTWVPRDWAGKIVRAGRDEVGPKLTDMGGPTYPIAAMPGRDGGGDALHQSLVSLVTEVSLGLPDHYGDPRSSNPADYPRYGTNWQGSSGEVVDLGLDAQGRRTMLLRDRDQMIYWSRLEGQVFSYPRIGGRLSGRLSVQAKKGGADVLRITSDGSIDRLLVEGDELKLSHLADVPVPKGEVGIGAFALGDRLVVATLAPGERTAFGGSQSLKLYRGDAPLGAGETTRIAQALTLTTHALEGFEDAVVVCWRGNDTATDLSKWKLDDAPPDGIALQDVHGDSCVVAWLDSRSNATVHPERDRVDADIPGVGRVLFDARNAVGAAFFGRRAGSIVGAAPLSDGTLVAAGRRLGRGGLDLGLYESGDMSRPDVGGVVDYGGAGLWVSYLLSATTGVFELRAATARPMTVTLVDGGVASVAEPLHAVWPTGVQVKVPGDSSYYLSPTGESSFVGERDAERSLCARLSDGTQCGVDLTGYYCKPRTGAVRTLNQANVTISQCRSWLPIGDGTFLVGSAGPGSAGDLFRFDPVAMTMTPYMTGFFAAAIAVDLQGRGLAVVYEPGKARLKLARASGLEVISVPETVWSHGGSGVNRAALTVTRDATFMHLGWSGGPSTLITFRAPPPAP